MRGSETGASGPRVAVLRIPRAAQGSLSPGGQADPTYPVIQSRNPSPAEREQDTWLAECHPGGPAPPPKLTPPTYLGL